MIKNKQIIPDGWRETTLGCVAGIRYGKDHKKLEDGKYPLYGSGGIMRHVDNFLYNKPSVLIPRKGSLNNLFYTEEPFWTVDTLFYTQIDETKNLPKFLFFKLKTLRLSEMDVGSAIPSLTTEVLNKIAMVIPSLEEQREIAGVLSGLDDKIELLNKQNETLEEIAKTIFKEWFIEFNFPNKDGKPYKKSGGKMIDSELGEIPEGWQVSKLGLETKIVYGKNLPINNLLDNGYSVFGGNGQIGFYDKYIYDKPQVTVACRGEASGNINITLPKSFVTNNSLILELLDKSVINFSFLKYWSFHRKYFDYVTGSAQPQITIQSLEDAQILVPQKEITDLFDGIVGSNNIKSLENLSQITSLENMRNSLLPKLMTGELRVK